MKTDTVLLFPWLATVILMVVYFREARWWRKHAREWEARVGEALKTAESWEKIAGEFEKAYESMKTANERNEAACIEAQTLVRKTTESTLSPQQ